MATKIQYQCCNPQCYPPNLPNSQCCLQKAKCSPQKAQFDSQNAQCSAPKARCSPQNAQCGSGEAQNADRCLKPESPKKEACSDCSFKEKEEPKPEPKPEPPDVMVCYKIKKQTSNKKKKPKVIRLKQTKSRELRGGCLYSGCLCEKRNGLQDDCPRSECHGQPECLNRPPTRPPSEYCDAKHLYKKQRENQRARMGLSKEDDSDAEDEYEFQCFPDSIENS